MLQVSAAKNGKRSVDMTRIRLPAEQPQAHTRQRQRLPSTFPQMLRSTLVPLQTTRRAHQRQAHRRVHRRRCRPGCPDRRIGRWRQGCPYRRTRGSRRWHGCRGVHGQPRCGHPRGVVRLIHHALFHPGETIGVGLNTEEPRCSGALHVEREALIVQQEIALAHDLLFALSIPKPDVEAEPDHVDVRR